MRITVIFDQPKWVIAKVGGFEYRYWQLRQYLANQGHNLTFIHLSYDSNADVTNFEGLDVRTIHVDGLPNSKIEKFKIIVRDLVNPRRILSHDVALDTLLRETKPDAVINLMASNPKLIRNLTKDFPTILFAEEDFSIGWDKVASSAGKLLQPGLKLRNRLIERSWSKPDSVIVISDPEHAWAARAYPGARVTTIPLFLPEEFWLEEVDPAQPPIDIFAMGRFDAVRNAFGLRKFIEELHIQNPENTPVVQIACWYKPHPLLEDLPPNRLVYLGNIPDARPLYRAAKICVVPAFSVSGAKNQVLQGWASHCTVVASTQSANSVNGVDGKDLLTGQNPRELASAALAALADENLRAHLVSNGAASLLEQHSRDRSLKLFAEELNLTVSQKKTS